MSFILVPTNGESVEVNAWNWRPTLELLWNAKLIDEDGYERMGANGCAGQVDAETAGRIADFIELTLNTIKPGERLLADLTVTSKPKKHVTFTSDAKIDAVDLYSASYEWLLIFRDFCRGSGGFEVL